MKQIIGFFMAILLLSACQKQPLPVPEYPVSAEALEQAMDAVGLALEHADVAVFRERQTAYELRTADGTLAAVLSSMGGSKAKDSRYLNLGFLSPGFASQKEDPLEEESWEQAVACASLLYGGFSGQSAVYDAWKETAAQQTVTEMKNGMEYRTWEQEVDGVQCTIICKKAEGQGTETHLLTIQFCNSDEFDFS